MDLHTYLKKKKLSQGDFAKKVGVTAGCISHLVRGIRRPRADLAVRIQAATGGRVRASDLMLGDLVENNSAAARRWPNDAGRPGLWTTGRGWLHHDRQRAPGGDHPWSTIPAARSDSHLSGRHSWDIRLQAQDRKNFQPSTISTYRNYRQKQPFQIQEKSYRFRSNKRCHLWQQKDGNLFD